MKPKIPMRYALQDPYIFGRQGQFILRPGRAVDRRCRREIDDGPARRVLTGREREPRQDIAVREDAVSLSEARFHVSPISLWQAV
jgi:hypothetical protein